MKLSFSTRGWSEYSWDELVQIHVKLYRAICAKDMHTAIEAVNEHYDFLLYLDEPTR